MGVHTLWAAVLLAGPLALLCSAAGKRKDVQIEVAVGNGPFWLAMEGDYGDSVDGHRTLQFTPHEVASKLTEPEEIVRVRMGDLYGVTKASCIRGMIQLGRDIKVEVYSGSDGRPAGLSVLTGEGCNVPTDLAKLPSEYASWHPTTVRPRPAPEIVAFVPSRDAVAELQDAPMPTAVPAAATPATAPSDKGKGAPEAKTAKDERGWFSRNWLYVAIGVMVALNVVQIFGGGAGAAGGAAQGGAAQG